MSEKNLSAITEPKTAIDFLQTATMQPKKYLTALDFVNAHANKLESFSNQLSLFTGPAYQSGIGKTIDNLRNSPMFASPIQASLPKIENWNASSALFKTSREATIALANLITPTSINQISESINKNYPLAFSLGNLRALDSNRPSDAFAKSIGTIPISALDIQSSLMKAVGFSTLAEKCISNLTPGNFGSKIRLAGKPKELLMSSVDSLSSSYLALFTSFKTTPSSFPVIHPLVSRDAPTEYFSLSNLLRSISVDQEILSDEELVNNDLQYENDILLSRHLPKLDPNLYNLWKGAIEAYHSKNSDKIRHFCTSIRELFTQIIHKLAPDEQVRKWPNYEKHVEKGKLTRKGRILFICRNINNGGFTDFVKKDVDATVAFINVFQEGTHAIEPKFSVDQLTAIKAKAENTLKFLLEIHFSTNS